MADSNEDRADAVARRVAEVVREMWLTGQQGTAVRVMGEIITISREAG
jgi:hypothetical protein